MKKRKPEIGSSRGRAPKTKIYSILETPKHVFTEWVDKNGTTRYRKDGKFASSRAFKAAIPHATRRTDSAVLRNRLDRPSHTQRDIALTDAKGRWRAGEDAHLYLPGVREGAVLKPSQITFLRTTRMRENNFRAFADLPKNEDLDTDEIEEAYYEFLDAISGLQKGMKRYAQIMKEYWGY